MKSDRLYAITLHLLNHGKTTAAELAESFEVSVRTIQRDIDSLCAAGIPIIAQTGSTGGYSLPESFIMDAQTATECDYSNILIALKGYSSAMEDPGIASSIEKISALSKKREDSIVLDFSVLRQISQSTMRILQHAIGQKRSIRFVYTNAQNLTMERMVEPVALVYRWYAWYLLAYSVEHGDYRTYKLVRMESVEETDVPFSRTHGSTDSILKEIDMNDKRSVTEIKAICKRSAKSKAVEYLNAIVTGELDNGDYEMSLYVIESEHFWFGSLLSFGSDITILSPEHIRKRLLAAAENILALYSNCDTTLS